MFFVNAQVKIPAPVGYSYTNSVDQRVLKSIYNYGNLIFAVAYQDGISSNQLSLFKVNIDDSSVTQIQLPSGSFSDLNSFQAFKNLGAYNNKFYFQSNNAIYEINIVTNICSFLFNISGGYINYCLFNGKIYYEDKYYDITSNQHYQFYTNTYPPIDPNITNYYYFNSYYTIYNNELYTIRGRSTSLWSSPISNCVIKIGSSGSFSTLTADVNNVFYMPTFSYPFVDFEFTNNRVFFEKHDYNNMVSGFQERSLISTNLSGGSLNTLHTNFSNAYYDSSLTKDNLLYFRPVLTGNTILRTDGVNVTDTGISDEIGFVIVGNEDSKYSRFKVFNNDIIGNKRFNDTNGYQQYEFFKSTDLSLANTTVLNSCSNNNLTTSCLPETKNIIEYNGNLYFHNSLGDWGIFKYDGINITELNIPSTNEMFNSAPLGDAYAYNNFLYYSTNLGLFKIDLSTAFLSTQETPKSTLKLYPNPTKSTLSFSEELTDIKIIDMGGKQVSATQSKTKTISVEKLPKGNYLITGKNKNGKTITVKFIKE